MELRFWWDEKKNTTINLHLVPVFLVGPHADKYQVPSTEYQSWVSKVPTNFFI